MLAAITTFAAYADLPILVGHRGSYTGVENTVESFTHGAKVGYTYLETDFKVTKDKQLVCSHDDDLSRLGGSSLTIAGNTLEDLQKVTFTQKRSGVTYTGRLCSAQEYLDVCKQYGALPLIELKWATGINSNDQSNIPLLIKLIEDNGFRNKCIILTSMKPCLEYIRKNYPDIELQFLTGEYWASHFDWCVQWGIDVDIQSGYFDKTTVERYHDKGLKVNVWTVNTDANYKTYGNYGCDFITTDYLDPEKLPELDPSVLFPQNTIDYPRNTGNVKGFYPNDEPVVKSLPAAISGNTVKKAIADGEEWIILSFDSQDNPNISRVNALTGNITATLSTDGVEKVGDIALSADKKIIVSDISGANKARLLQYVNESAAPVELINQMIVTPISANETVGRHIAVSGRVKDIKIYLSTETSGTTGIAGLHISNGVLTESAVATTTSLGAKDWGNYTITVTPTSRNCFIINSMTTAPVEYLFNWTETNKPLEVYSEFSKNLNTLPAEGISFSRRSMKTYAAIPVYNEGLEAALYDVTDGFAAPAPISANLLGDVELNGTVQYAASGIVELDNRLYVNFLIAPFGLVSVPLDSEKEVVKPEIVELELTRNWIFSESTNNTPEHIDGTNAQQGTAVNGHFYINDCVDKKIHIFNKTGYLGSIPGGAGWGCARDDAGNIIVRDDKLTGTSHSFIVYPAGATPESYGEPVKFTATVNYSGQTNFINAGGDLLNGTGHIYLFPNKQNAVNIITVTKGKVTGCSGASGLSLTGSTAGYVLPIDDDPENWLYQIRTTGIYSYSGGINTAYLTTRSTTTQPARNSTGGMAHFTLAGNNILVHNSGSNYLGGFTVRNMTTDKVIDNVAPIGTKGYATGGNYSTFNWLISEKVSDHEYTIYQYCPANGFGCYTLLDKLSGVEDIATDLISEWSLEKSGNIITVKGIEVNTLKIYDLAGRLVKESADSTINTSGLAKGIYIIAVNNSKSKKLAL